MTAPDYFSYYQKRVPRLEKKGGEWRGPCPIHNGERDSFAVDMSTGKWKCHNTECVGGGDVYQLERHLYPQMKFPQAKKQADDILGVVPERRAFGEIVATYDYVDEQGELLYQVVRYEPKEFRQRRPDQMARGGWNWSIKGVRRILYRLPQVMRASHVFFVEGEKDVETIESWGLVATTSSGGAEKFPEEMAQAFRGKHVCIIPDNDGPGQKHAEKVGAYISLHAAKVVVLRLPDNIKDISDWRNKGGTKDQFLELAKDAKPWARQTVVNMPVKSDSTISQNLHDMLERYVILHGSENIWDDSSKRIVSPTSLRLSHNADFSGWLKHPDRRRIDHEDLVFAPQGEKPGQINIFTGFDMEPDPLAVCSMLVGHIQHICGGDMALTHWLTCWLAYPLQRPGAKMRTSVVVRGRQGSGKNLLFDQLLRIYGRYGTTISQTQLESPYTAWLSGKLFVLADEVLSKAERVHVKNRLKSIITGDRLIIEDKYKSPREESNHCNLVFLSNEEVPVILEEGDRRYTVIECDNVKPADYYQRIALEICAGGVQGLYSYLLSYPLGDFDEHTKPYWTKAKEELTRLCLPSVDKFFSEWQDSQLPVPFGPCLSVDLYEAYTIWAKGSGEAFKVSQTAFGRAASKRYQKTRIRAGFAQHPVTVITPSGQAKETDIEVFKGALDIWLQKQQGRRL